MWDVKRKKKLAETIPNCQELDEFGSLNGSWFRLLELGRALA